MKAFISFISVLLVAFLLLDTQSASASIITVEVTGIVDEIWVDNGLTLDGSVSEGLIMTGSTTYDTDTPDLFPQFDHRGDYQLISISMTVGNYTFTNDPAHPDDALFKILTSLNFSQTAKSYAPRFDGTVYIDGSPKTYDEVNFDELWMALLFLSADNDYGITDALPDSFLDLSVYRDKFFRAGSYGDHIGPGFCIAGELTSITVIPEPATVFLLGLGSLALIRHRRENRP